MLVNMKDLLLRAKKENKCLAAFSVYNMEAILGVIEACEEENTPAIIQIAESRFEYSPLEIMAPMMVEAAENSKVEIAVHLDHGLTFDVIKKALDYGFTSVMFDGSKLSLEENIKKTKEVVELAKTYGASVEAELGVVGGDEGMGNQKIIYTDLEQAKLFVNETKVDALAIAIGNAHGVYKGEPKLNFEVLSKLNDNLDLPLVLHGGSGISKEDFQQSINLGIRKINIATSNLQAQMKAIRNSLTTEPDVNYFELNKKVREEIKNNSKVLINVFNMNELNK